MKKRAIRRNKRVEDHLKLVTPIARHYAQRCGIDADDLSQVGVMGLIRAAENFNSERCTPFNAFARPHIRGAILHYLRDHSAMVRCPRRLQESNTHTEPGEISQRVPLHRVYSCEDAFPDLNSEVAQDIGQEERTTVIRNTLRALHKPERSAIQDVILDGRSLRAAGKAAGVSAMTMQRRVKRGLEQLRLKLDPQLWTD